MNEPHAILIRAAVGILNPVVNDLRKRGWAVDVVAHADPLKVTLELDLSGLKVPVEGGLLMEQFTLCRRTGSPAESGACPVHFGDECLSEFVPLTYADDTKGATD